MKTLKFLALIGLLGILGAIGAGFYFFGGFFNVAATIEDPKIVEWALDKVRQASILRNAKERPQRDLSNADLVKQGAQAFAKNGCATCHGAPGVEWAKFADGLNPGAADLHEIAEQREPREIFFVIKNGIKMTGMPSFSKAEVPDADIWSIVAFIKGMDKVSEDDYKAWTGPAPTSPPASAPAPTPTPSPGATPPGGNP